ncbi:YciI family protein [Methylobacterium sp. SyP6R]|uniref:YciI family protein n=1 Tax=Methylobacterium sp. SyP6R TaxID=2718876 RepID=UPI001F25AEA5|nr:YciI family protein [Methylobacterium sp. SyP6R]MCF4130031.1 YciI family protein [Methylobacterium sp. SyP6R]
MIVILYCFVADFMKRRQPYRAEHLAYVAAEQAAGRIAAGGALSENLRKGLILYRGTVEQAEAFVAADPYVRAGIVTSREIGTWTLVIGDRMEVLT